MTPELMVESRSLLDAPPSSHPGLWERAAILLARQALEESLDDFWLARSPDLLHASMRAQLLCLGPLMNNDHDAAQVAQLWGALSDACHFNTYQPTPSPSEVHTWLDQTECFCALLARKAGRTVAHT